jgi:hypothetical protein
MGGKPRAVLRGTGSSTEGEDKPLTQSVQIQHPTAPLRQQRLPAGPCSRQRCAAPHREPPHAGPHRNPTQVAPAASVRGRAATGNENSPAAPSKQREDAGDLKTPDIGPWAGKTLAHGSPPGAPPPLMPPDPSPIPPAAPTSRATSRCPRWRVSLVCRACRLRQRRGITPQRPSRDPSSHSPSHDVPDRPWKGEWVGRSQRGGGAWGPGLPSWTAGPLSES